MARSNPHSSRARRKRPTSEAEKRTSSHEVLPADQPHSGHPTPRIGSLRDVDGIRLEMGRVYREARRGSLDTREAGRLVYMLGELRKCYEISVLERRLIALESQ
jgi:hypothetical protein